jgi:hypothetical protein
MHKNYGLNQNFLFVALDNRMMVATASGFLVKSRLIPGRNWQFISSPASSCLL